MRYNTGQDKQSEKASTLHYNYIVSQKKFPPLNSLKFCEILTLGHLLVQLVLPLCPVDTFVIMSHSLIFWFVSQINLI